MLSILLSLWRSSPSWSKLLHFSLLILLWCLDLLTLTAPGHKRIVAALALWFLHTFRPLLWISCCYCPCFSSYLSCHRTACTRQIFYYTNLHDPFNCLFPVTLLVTCCHAVITKYSAIIPGLQGQRRLLPPTLLPLSLQLLITTTATSATSTTTSGSCCYC